jgi:ferrous iron transport protein B
MVLELPPYRVPSIRSAVLTTYDRALVFLKNAGSVILAICIIMWWLSAYPKVDTPADAAALEARAAMIAAEGEATTDSAVQTTLAAEAESLTAEAELISARAQQEYSFAGRIGSAVEPAFAPLGLDERLTVAVLTSFLAREVFRSTITVLVGSGDSEDDRSVAEELSRATRADGTRLFDPATSTALLVFFVLAMQCLPTLAVTRRETGSWKWPAVQLVWMSAVAYLAAWIARLLVLGFTPPPGGGA